MPLLATVWMWPKRVVTCQGQRWFTCPLHSILHQPAQLMMVPARVLCIFNKHVLVALLEIHCCIAKFDAIGVGRLSMLTP